MRQLRPRERRHLLKTILRISCRLQASTLTSGAVLPAAFSSQHSQIPQVLVSWFWQLENIKEFISN